MLHLIETFVSSKYIKLPNASLRHGASIISFYDSYTDSMSQTFKNFIFYLLTYIINEM